MSLEITLGNLIDRALKRPWYDARRKTSREKLANNMQNFKHRQSIPNQLATVMNLQTLKS